MTLEEMKKRLESIVNELNKYSDVEKYSDEDVENINKLNSEYEELKKQIEAKEKVLAFKATVDSTKITNTKKETKRIEVVGSRYDKTLGFKNFGDFATAVAQKSMGKLDQRLQNSAAYEMFTEDGGLLVPDEFIANITEKVMGDQSLLPRTTSFSIQGNHLSLTIDENAAWNGGITAYWMNEGSQYQDSKGALTTASWKLHKLGALVKATDELLEDASALESYIDRKAPEAFTYAINNAILNGDGVAKPKGILNSNFKVSVDAESGQAADTIVYKNLLKMSARLVPSANAVWIADPSVKEQLRLLKDDNGNSIYMNGGSYPNMSAPSFDLLLGRPIIYLLGLNKPVGDEGDIILADLSYYYSAFKTRGVKRDVSTHLLFDRDITAFKFVMRIDGSCPFNSPIVSASGYELSGFITLKSR